MGTKSVQADTMTLRCMEEGGQDKAFLLFRPMDGIAESRVKSRSFLKGDDLLQEDQVWLSTLEDCTEAANEVNLLLGIDG